MSDATKKLKKKKRKITTVEATGSSELIPSPLSKATASSRVTKKKKKKKKKQGQTGKEEKEDTQREEVEGAADEVDIDDIFGSMETERDKVMQELMRVKEEQRKKKRKQGGDIKPGK